jgi:hypothetical protein
LRDFVLRLVVMIAFALAAGQAVADDWNVVRLRGTVMELVDGQWRPLTKGSIVSDNRVVLTRLDGHATLTRGSETIELAPNTQIQIYDQGGRRPFTTVVQHFGTVTIEADVRNVQHFAVKNQYLAAVVKGTRFVVTAGRFGASVDVRRGQVSVTATEDHSTTMVVAGQGARVDKGHSMTVSGKGTLPPVVKKGVNSGDAAKAPLAKAADDAAKAAEKAANGADSGKTGNNSGHGKP